MKRFRFRLERVLSWRLRAETQARRRLGLAMVALARAQASVERAESVQAELQAEAGTLVLSGRAGALPLQRELLAGAAAAACEGRRKERELEKERVAALGAWREARAARRSLELFRERARDRFQLESRRAEAREMDEVARAGFVSTGGAP